MGAEQFEPPNQFQPHNNDTESVRIKTPVGEIDASGKNIILIVILICCCLTLFFIYALKESAAQDHKVVVEKIEKSGQAVDELVYMQTLTTEEKQKLRLTMPESLRKKVRGLNDN
jgi:hypothetical protein